MSVKHIFSLSDKILSLTYFVLMYFVVLDKQYRGLDAKFSETVGTAVWC